MKVKDIFRVAEDQGFKIETTKKGLKIIPPDSQYPVLFTHGHDYNAKAILSDLKRRGLKWPYN